MSRFVFKTDAQGEAFSERVVQEMVRRFGISEAEAVSRVNDRWAKLELTEAQHPIYHEDEEHWAKDIYFGHESFWWLDEANAKPLPFP